MTAPNPDPRIQTANLANDDRRAEVDTLIHTAMKAYMGTSLNDRIRQNHRPVFDDDIGTYDHPGFDPRIPAQPGRRIHQSVRTDDGR